MFFSIRTFPVPLITSAFCVSRQANLQKSLYVDLDIRSTDLCLRPIKYVSFTSVANWSQQMFESSNYTTGPDVSSFLPRNN